jgi:hypothetical protein
MPGSGQKFTTTGTGGDVTVAALIPVFDPTPSFAISVRADPNNSSSTPVYLGRQAAYEPFYPNDSRTFYSCRPEELVFNDQKVSGAILYFDFSGPMDPLAQYATVVTASGTNQYRKAPNDPTP